MREKTDLAILQECIVNMDQTLKELSHHIERVAENGAKTETDIKIMMACTRFVHSKHKLDKLIENLN